MNPEHVEIVRQGSEAIATWRRAHPDEQLDLVGADLRVANLALANLALVNLREANLNVANLSGAYLGGACLGGADLGGAFLYRTHFDATDLAGAQFPGARFGRTVVADCDLSVALGLHAVEHLVPSSIGLDTLMKTFRGTQNRWTAELRKFFLNAGVGQQFLDQLPGIVADVKYYSCFIAYGEPDRGFAERLYQDLGARGISRWMYAMDSTPGERTQREIGLKRREAEKFIVLCSAQGFVRDGVLKEIEEQMDEDPDKTIPISLDDLWKHAGIHVVRAGRNLKPFLMDRNYADFGQGQDYDRGFQRLLRALLRKDT